MTSHKNTCTTRAQAAVGKSCSIEVWSRTLARANSDASAYELASAFIWKSKSARGNGDPKRALTSMQQVSGFRIAG